MGKSNLIVKIAIAGRKHPEHRKFYVALLAGAVLLRMIRRKIAGLLPKARELAVAGAAMAVMVLCFSNNLTDGAATPYSTDDAKLEAQGFARTIDVMANGELDLPAYVTEDMLPWNLTLVNNKNPLDDDYSLLLTKVSRGYEVDSRIYEPLTEMLQSGWNQGMDLMICSAYRSYETQTELFNTAVKEAMLRGMTEEEAKEYASFSYSAPGASEHQAAIAVDIVATYHQNLDNAFANTKEAKWLYEHCAEYGFILRYPEDKTEITGIKYEPWHFRYVGVEAATTIMEEDLTLEEYLRVYYPNYSKVYLHF